MTPTEIMAWIANITFFVSYLLVSNKIIEGGKKTYSFMILGAVTFYAIYSLANGYAAMLTLNLTNIWLGSRHLYRLYTNPDKHYKYRPVLFHIMIILVGTTLAIATRPTFIEVLTWIGGGFFLSAYYLLSSGKITEKGFTFNAMYLTAAILWIIWGIADRDIAITGLEIFLILVSLIALGKLFKSKITTPTKSSS